MKNKTIGCTLLSLGLVSLCFQAHAQEGGAPAGAVSQPAQPAPQPQASTTAAPAETKPAETQPAPQPAAPAPEATAPKSQATPVEPGYHEHDGFYLRLLLGGGYSWAWSKKDGIGYHSRGLSGVSDLALGYSVIDNLAITFESFGGTQFNSQRRITGADESDNIVFPVKNIIMIGFGPGITYTFMPINLYLTMALGGSYMHMSWRKIEGDNLDLRYKDFDPGIGFGMHEALGKEWWVGGDWGIGVGAEFFYLAIPDIDKTWFNDMGFGASFSLTYN